jgi:hypothetical protein
MQAYQFPSALTAIGAVGEEGQPAAGQPFFRLNGAAVRQGVSAFMVVTVIGKSGTPLIGAKVLNLFPDGNGEILQTDGSGVARFQFGASSAFTNPGTGPFTIFVADDSAFKDSDSIPKRVVFKARLSDIVKSLGDFQGQHTEINIQFVEQTVGAVEPPITQPPVTQPPATLPIVHNDDELRNLGYAASRLSYNPDAALVKWARAHGLGMALASESKYVDANGVHWVWQPFVLGIARCVDGDWGNIKKVDW